MDSVAAKQNDREGDRAMFDPQDYVLCLHCGNGHIPPAATQAEQYRMMDQCREADAAAMFAERDAVESGV